MEDQAIWSIIHKAWGAGGHKQFRVLLERAAAQALWENPTAVLKSLQVETPADFPDKLKLAKTSVDVGRIRENLEKYQIRLVSYNDDEYPEKLKYIYNPPSLLYVKGALPDANKLAVAMVGSRKCTEYGKRVAQSLGADLARNGCVVISGLARGIDSFSHQGALEAQGCTFGVLGCGVDVVYPRENKALFQQMVSREGCGIISELPLGSEPLKHHFPMRNRIISGLADGLVVVEAAVKSGALITAELALEQGKDVFAVPGPITSSQSGGTHKLIKDGAKLVCGVEDILEEYGQLCLFAEEKVQDNDVPLGNKEKKVLECVGIEPVSVEEVAVMAKLPIEEIVATLSWLEINGLVVQIVGRKYIRLG